MEIEYKILKADHIPLYREIRLECLRKHPDNFGHLFENEKNAKTLKFDSVLMQEDSSSFLCGAFQQNNLIGICGFTRDTRFKRQHRGEISQMYVRDEYAGQGIGTQILKFALNNAFAVGALEIVELGVVNNNQKALRVYSNIGFITVGEFENYFKHLDTYWGFTFMVLTKVDYFYKNPN